MIQGHQILSGNIILDGLNIPFVKGKSRFYLHKKGFKINCLNG
jgi:hypothetical protein